MASPVETPTWDRTVQCGCKGCAVSRNNERQMILAKLKEVVYNLDVPWTLGSHSAITNLINELEENK